MIVIYILAGIGLIVLGVIVYWCITDWQDQRHENNYWKREKEAFKIVHTHLNGAQYWLVGDDRKPYRDLIQFICLELEKGHHISGERLRAEVDRINSLTIKS